MRARFTLLAALGLAATLACDDPQAPTDPTHDGTNARLRAPETPTVHITSPVGRGSESSAPLPGAFRVNWEGVRAADQTRVIGYRMKMVKLANIFDRIGGHLAS